MATSVRLMFFCKTLLNISVNQRLPSRLSINPVPVWYRYRLREPHFKCCGSTTNGRRTKTTVYRKKKKEKKMMTPFGVRVCACTCIRVNCSLRSKLAVRVCVIDVLCFSLVFRVAYYNLQTVEPCLASWSSCPTDFRSYSSGTNWRANGREWPGKVYWFFFWGRTATTLRVHSRNGRSARSRGVVDRPV